MEGGGSGQRPFPVGDGTEQKRKEKVGRWGGWERALERAFPTARQKKES